jgi:RNA polymerase sigma factor (sigma-70 family)
MSQGRITHLLHRLVGEARAGGEGALTDAELLRRYCESRDEAAFELLVRRHGPMVLGLCRRVLGREQDAEDAFQASFLALACKAASIGRQEAVASWLHRVALRVALRARAARARQTPVAELSDVEQPAPADAGLPPELDEEVSRLPWHYRAPVILCYLGDTTPEQAARELGLSPAALYQRLARARNRLRERLIARGASLPAAVALPAFPMSWACTAAGAAARLAAGLPTGLSPLSLSLMQGALRAMFLRKLTACASVLALALTVAAGVAVPLVVGGPPAARRPAEKGDKSPEPDRPKKTPIKLSVELPKAAPTLAEVNSGRYEVTVRLENTGKENLVLWPFLFMKVMDARSAEVRPVMSIGDGPPSRPGTHLERARYITLRPGESHRFLVSLKQYAHAPFSLMGWRLRSAGDYTLAFTYSYSRAEMKKVYGKGTKDIDGKDKPWNRALEADEKIEAKIRVK